MNVGVGSQRGAYTVAVAARFSASSPVVPSPEGPSLPGDLDVMRTPIQVRFWTLVQRQFCSEIQAVVAARRG